MIVYHYTIGRNLAGIINKEGVIKLEGRAQP
jgi:hypothetical protein